MDELKVEYRKEIEAMATEQGVWYENMTDSNEAVATHALCEAGAYLLIKQRVRYGTQVRTLPRLRYR